MNPKRKSDDQLSEQTPKRKFHYYAKSAVEKLEEFFLTNAYPHPAERRKLSESIGEDDKNVQKWFKNRRVKAKRRNEVMIRGDSATKTDSSEKSKNQEGTSTTKKYASKGKTAKQTFKATAPSTEQTFRPAAPSVEQTFRPVEPSVDQTFRPAAPSVEHNFTLESPFDDHTFRHAASINVNENSSSVPWHNFQFSPPSLSCFPKSDDQRKLPVLPSIESLFSDNSASLSSLLPSFTHHAVHQPSASGKEDKQIDGDRNQHTESEKSPWVFMHNSTSKDSSAYTYFPPTPEFSSTSSEEQCSPSGTSTDSSLKSTPIHYVDSSNVNVTASTNVFNEYQQPLPSSSISTPSTSQHNSLTRSQHQFSTPSVSNIVNIPPKYYGNTHYQNYTELSDSQTAPVPSTSNHASTTQIARLVTTATESITADFLKPIFVQTSHSDTIPSTSDDSGSKKLPKTRNAPNLTPSTYQERHLYCSVSESLPVRNLNSGTVSLPHFKQDVNEHISYSSHIPNASTFYPAEYQNSMFPSPYPQHFFYNQIMYNYGYHTPLNHVFDFNQPINNYLTPPCLPYQQWPYYPTVNFTPWDYTNPIGNGFSYAQQIASAQSSLSVNLRTKMENVSHVSSFTNSISPVMKNIETKSTRGHKSVHETSKHPRRYELPTLHFAHNADNYNRDLKNPGEYRDDVVFKRSEETEI